MLENWVSNQVIRIIFLSLGFLVVFRQAELELRSFLKIFLISLLSSIVAPFWVWFQLGKFQGDVHGVSASYAFLGIFALLSVHWHRGQLVKRINEGTVLLLTLSFEFFLFSSETELGRSVAVATSPFAVFAALCAFTRIRIGFWVKALLMIWFCLMSCVLGARQFVVTAYHVSQFEGRWMGYLSLFMLSAVFLQLLANASLLMSLAPGKIKQGRVSNAARKDIHFVTGRLESKQIPPFLAMIATLFFALPMLLNEAFSWVPREMAYSTTLMLTPIYSEWCWSLERKI